jgi:hypothetical protein
MALEMVQVLATLLASGLVTMLIALLAIANELV